MQNESSQKSLRQLDNIDAKRWNKLFCIGKYYWHFIVSVKGANVRALLLKFRRKCKKLMLWAEELPHSCGKTKKIRKYINASHLAGIILINL